MHFDREVQVRRADRRSNLAVEMQRRLAIRPRESLTRGGAEPELVKVHAQRQ